MGISLCFSAVFTLGDISVTSFSLSSALTRLGHSLRKEFVPMEQSLSCRSLPHLKRNTNTEALIITTVFVTKDFTVKSNYCHKET